MPGNPEQCRLNAARCLKLAKRARRPEMRETFTALADTWTRLAAEHEFDEALGAPKDRLSYSSRIGSNASVRDCVTGHHSAGHMIGDVAVK